MTAMKKFMLTAVGLTALGIAPALAADLPARPAPAYTKAPAIVTPIYDWAGFYIGINGGGGSSHNCWSIIDSAGCHNATVGLVGGQVGYRWQMTNWVFGLEAQGGWANLKGSNTSAFGTFGGQPFLNQTKIDGIGLFTGQVGYAWSNVLWYAKGGAALTHDTYNGIGQVAEPGFPVGSAFDQASETRWGGAVGTGIEFGFAPNWSIAIEYDHLFMGTKSLNFTTPAGVFDRNNNVQQAVDMGTVRINYRFGGPVVAKY